jgi:sensor histidine kinase YesM
MSVKNFYIDRYKIPAHICFWVVWMSLNIVFLGSGEDNYKRQLAFELYELPEKIIAVYLNLYVLVPRLLLKKKYLQYVLALFAMLFLVALSMRAVYLKFLAAPYFPETANQPFFQAYRIFKYIFYNLNAVIFITTGIRLFFYWYQQQQLNNELVKGKLEAELHYLKGQLNPHFLFNTLNNVYSLSLKKSDMAPMMILKLSSLMSYMLYDSQKDRIDLMKDLEYTKNYIEVEKLRYGNRLKVSLNESGDLKDKSIAPLLMLPFVENAFKHGLCEDAEEVWLTIDVKLKQDTLYLKVRNSVDELSCDEGPLQFGVGLQNIKRRLELLYPGRYSLDITKDLNYFEVDLKIKM